LDETTIKEFFLKAVNILCTEEAIITIVEDSFRKDYDL